MKIFIVVVSFLALSIANAEIAFSNKHHTQHEQSVSAAKQSLQERLSKFDDPNHYNSRLYGNAYGSSGSEKYVTGCSSCIGGGSENRYSSSSRHSSSSSSQRSGSSGGHGIDKADYVGVGIVGRSSDAIDSDLDVQSVVAPTYVGGSSRYSSSNNAFEAEDLQQRQVPADLSSVSSSAYRSSVLDKSEDDVQRTVGHGYQPSYGSSRIYSSSRDGSSSHTSSNSAVPVYTSGGTTSHRSSSSHSESEHSESRKPIPTGQYVSMQTRPGVATVVALPIRVITTNGVPSDHQDYYTRTSDNSESSQTSSRVQHPTSTTYRVTYVPSRNYVTSDKISSSSSHDSTSSRVSGGDVQQPEKLTTYNSFGVPESASQTRYRSEDSDSYSEGSQQVRVAPVSISYPTNGGSSRTASSGSSSSHHGYTQSRVAPAFNYNAIDSASSTRTAAEKDERRYTAPAPTYLTSSRTSDSSSGSEQVSSSNYGTSGSTYYIPSSSRTQTQYQSGSGSQSQTQFQSGSGSGSQTQYQRGYGGSFTPYGSSRTSSSNYGSSGSSSDILSTRYGTGIVDSGSDDLKAYMSEAERLAKLQQQQISGSSSNYAITSSDANRRTLQTASNLDSAAANFVRSSNVANRNSEFDTTSLDGSGVGGYNRVRSWNKQSKWASGSEYGADGKPKSYSHLSTAEAEKYNINGNEAGYKAATTTLENDGKVSTYSIHTP